MLVGLPSLADASKTRMHPGCSLATLNATLVENVPKAGPPADAVVKASTMAWPAASMIVMLTVASNTRARPEIRTGLVTRAPDVGESRNIEGSAGLGGLGFGGQAPAGGRVATRITGTCTTLTGLPSLADASKTR